MKIVYVLFLLSVVAIGGYIVFGGSTMQSPDIVNNQESSESNPLDNADFDNKPRLVIGDESADVRIVEYIDFKCVACNRFHQSTGEELREKYIDTNIAYLELRTYPFIGPDSGRSARGLYCAQKQNATTYYHDAVFDYVWDNFYDVGNMEAEFQDILTSDVLSDLMRNQVADIDSFKDCLDDTSLNAFIDADLLLGAEDGANATPAFVIGEQTFVGPQPLKVFDTLIGIQQR